MMMTMTTQPMPESITMAGVEVTIVEVASIMTFKIDTVDNANENDSSDDSKAEDDEKRYNISPVH